MEQKNIDIFSSGLDETAKAHLLETTRWTKFLAIASFIGLGLMILSGIFLASFVSTYSTTNSYSEGSGILVGYVIVALIYFYPLFALLKFSSNMKNGILTNNQELINEGFRYQKGMFRYIGIVMIIGLFFFLLAMMFGGLGLLANR
jgi:hypothetical protein